MDDLLGDDRLEYHQILKLTNAIMDLIIFIPSYQACKQVLEDFDRVQQHFRGLKYIYPFSMSVQNTIVII